MSTIARVVAPPHEQERSLTSKAKKIADRPSTSSAALFSGAEEAAPKRRKVALDPQQIAALTAPPPPFRPAASAKHLHDVTHAPELGIGALAAVALKVKPSQSHDFWDEEAVFDESTVTPGGAGSARAFPSPSPIDELWRMRAMANLNRTFEKLCATHGNAAMTQPVPIMAFERFHCRAKLREDLRVEQIDPVAPTAAAAATQASSTASTAGATPCRIPGVLTALDPLLPSALGAQYASSALIADLVRVGMTEKAARLLSRELIAACSKSITASPVHPSNVNKAASSPPSSSSSSSSNAIAEIHVVSHQFSSDIVCGGKLLKINHSHLKKLRTLFTRTPSAPAAAANDTDAFHRALFNVLARYHTHGGHGYQAALNEHAFAVLHERFQVGFECFASPLNCRYGRYCSAYPDTDAAFGSLGSFFSCRFNRGSFEANPPFVPELMQAMALRIESILAASGAPSVSGLQSSSSSTNGESSSQKSSSSSSKKQRPLSFVVIVPGWRDAPMWKTLHESAFLRAAWLIAAADHGFTDGAQHQRQDRFRAAPFDTCVFVLQNEAGARRWPANASIEFELREAMAQAVPTPAAVARRLARGRGDADADGGGKKAFKGKRANKCG